MKESVSLQVEKESRIKVEAEGGVNKVNSYRRLVTSEMG
ncbi:hypothetical protein BHO_0900028 (plasmid) [Borrelia hermsii YBT]|uniref:Uncharacterized protein n=1 Tax=Borrelia hermsii YBT TaxID=1313295 RepID=W5T2C0_BORHE|nr:hypothetical protein BHO_0900028 [Borrelia hermsii YBT]